LAYSYDMTPYLAPAADSIAQVSLSTSPSGAGELQAVDLSVTGNVFTVQFTSGVPGRAYSNLILVTGRSGRVWNLFGYIMVQVIQRGGYPLAPPSSPGYGPPIIWTGSTP
jgi:hypothetical protein